MKIMSKTDVLRAYKKVRQPVKKGVDNVGKAWYSNKAVRASGG